MIRRVGLLLVVALVAALPALPAPAAGPSPGEVRVGTLTLRPCHVAGGALCGSLRRAWEPGNPAAGTIRVGFAFVPARDSSRPAVGTVVPREGGPGYSTTSSGSGYAAMYGPLLDRRNMLLVDQRGTGLSEPINCPLLQDSDLPYADAAAVCGAQLGDRADDYTTALSADDLAAVIRALRLAPVDLYGDSYGTFFAQVFTGRHPQLVRSVVLDSAYPSYGESGWYPTQGPAMRRSFQVVCARSPACRRAGDGFLPTLEKVLAQVRAKPWRGTALRRGRPQDAGDRERPGAGRRRLRGDVHTGRSTASSPQRCAPVSRATGRRCSGSSPRRPAAAPTPGRCGPTARAWPPR